MLLPLRAGNYLLPHIEIRPMIKSGTEKDADGAEKLNCETDYLSYGECVMVVPDVSSSTVGIGEMSTGRSVVWLEGQGRQ